VALGAGVLCKESLGSSILLTSTIAAEHGVVVQLAHNEKVIGSTPIAATRKRLTIPVAPFMVVITLRVSEPVSRVAHNHESRVRLPDPPPSHGTAHLTGVTC
jgi:hypothetical protein